METPNFTTPGCNMPTVYTVNQVLRTYATSKPCFLVSNYKLSASKPFSVYISAVPSTCAKERMPSLIPLGFLEAANISPKAAFPKCLESLRPEEMLGFR